MRNNEYTATPNWFKQEPTDSQANIYQTNYYIGGSSTSGSSVLSSISLYNKYITNTYTLTVDDLVIPNTAIIAVDSELPEDQERPEGSVSEIGNSVSVENWYTSYSIRVLPGTTIKANLKANTLRYGIAFYNKYNTPISGYTPSEDKLVEISVPDSANYFRCCHYIDSESELDSFYIEYQGVDKYNDDQLNEAYSGTFEDFTSVNNDIQEGIIKDTINNTQLKLIFQQPLQFTTDKVGNIKVELNNDVLKDTLLSNDYVTTIENNPQDILSQKNFKQGLKINGIEIVEQDGFIFIKGDLAVTGGITAYAQGNRTPSTILDGLPIDETTLSKEGGKLTVIGGTGGGATNWDELQGKPSWIGDTKPTYTWTEITNKPSTFTPSAHNHNISEINNLQSSLDSKAEKTYVDRNFVTLSTEQTISGLKHFTNGLSVGTSKKKVYEKNGVLYINSDVAITGGLTTFAIGNSDVSTIMDGVIVDNITIIKENGVLKVVGSTGSLFDEEAMWIALSSSDSSKQINASHLSNVLSSYATRSWVQSQGYASQSSLNSVSNKLNDFLEGSDTDTIINKWKELEAFLSGMIESDNLADILSTKADKSYVDTEFKKYVTLSTEQTISGVKHFTNGLSIGSGKHKLYEENGIIYLDGDLAVKGGVTTYAVSESEISTVMDGVAVDGTTIKKENGVLVAIAGSGASFDKSAMWDALQSSTTEQINKSHLTTALSGYATETWVTNKNYAVKSTTLAGYGITDAYTKTESNNTFVNVSGDTMTGSLFINSSSTYPALTLKNTGYGANKVYLGVASNDDFLMRNVIDGANIDLRFNSVSLRYKDNIVWHEGNDGSGSGLDADLLDGTHKSGLFTALSSTSSTNLSITIGGTTKTIVDLNANSATKLETARTIWGQSFDGTKNVSGALTNVTNITGTGTFTSANAKVTDSVYINGIRLHKSQDGVIKLEGNLAVTGGITAYAVDEVDIPTIMDGVAVDGTTIAKVDGVLKVLNAGGGEAGSVKWENIENKPSWIGSTKPTYSWSEITSKPSTFTPPLASSTTRGGVKIGYAENGRNYPVELSNEQMFVNVPWTDTKYTLSSFGITATAAEINKLDGAIITTAELNRLDGVTSNVQTQLNNKLNSSQYTAADILTKLKTVDGSGSGLDADLLDGLHRVDFLSSGNKPYYRLFKLTITEQYVNQPITFEICGRSSSKVCFVSISFANLNTLDPTIESLLYFGDNKYGQKLRIYKTDTSVWELWMTGQEEGYDSCGIYNIKKTSGITLTITNAQTDALPTSTTYRNAEIASIYANLVGNSYSATKLRTPRTLWGRSFDGTANISGNLDSVGVITGSGVLQLIGNDDIYLKRGGVDNNSLVLGINRFKPFDSANNNIDLGYSTGKWRDLYVGRNAFIDGYLRINASSSDATHQLNLLVESSYTKIQANGSVPLAINPDGNNVGIGKTSPSKKLDVNGSTATTDLYINGIRLYKSQNGVLKLEGSLLVSGGITAYSTGEEGSGSSGGLDVDLMWEILGGTGTQQINKTHLTDALNGYATRSWVTSQNYLKSVSIATISDLNSSWDALLKATPSAYVTRWPSWSEVTGKPTTFKPSAHSHSTLDRIELSGTVDLDTLNLSSGSPKKAMYICKTDGGGANITGRPNDSSKTAFMLTVELIRWAGATDYISKQTYVRGTEKIIWVRYCTNGTWTSWERVYTTAHKPTLSELGAAASSHNHSWANITSGKPTTISGYGITDAYTKTECTNTFVNVSGDTMTGTLTTRGRVYTQSSNRTDKVGLFQSSTSNKGGLILQDTSGTEHVLYLSASNLEWKGRKVWDNGNDGSGSGLDSDLLDGVHLNGIFTNFSYSQSNLTATIGKVSKTVNVVGAYPNLPDSDMNTIASYGNCMGMVELSSSSSNINPNNQTGWHHFINMSYTTSSNNMWQSQIAIKAGTTEVWVRSRMEGTISDSSAWSAPWVRLARTTDTVSNADKLDGIHANGLLTALSSSSTTNLSLTVGGTTKTIADLYATTANKWLTARKINFNGFADCSLSIDGSKDVNMNYYPYNFKSLTGNKNNYPWHRIAKIGVISSSYYDAEITLLLSNGYYNGYSGIIKIALRTNNTGTNSTVTADWIYRKGYSVGDIVVGLYNVSGQTYADVFLKQNSTYAGNTGVVLTQANRSSLTRLWTLIDSNEVNGTTTSNKLTSTECWVSVDDAATELHSKAYSTKVTASDSANVNSSNKLSVTRTLWGQNFDGTANVSGSLSGVANISASGTLTSSYSSSTYVNALKNSVINCNISVFGGWIRGNTKNGRIALATYPGSDNRLYFGYAEQSKIDAGTNSFTHEMIWIGDTGGLIVKGDILAQGGITCYSSDARAKTIIDEINLSLEQIAESPTIRFKWNGWNIPDDGKTHLGGIAQYVQKILPECVLDTEGMLHMDYATTAYIYSVQTAKHLQTYETKTDKEIRNLKNRIKYLEKQLKKLGYEEIDTMVN